MDQILEKWDEILMTVKTEHDISDIAFNVPLNFMVSLGTPHISLSRPSSWDSAIFPRSTICRSK
mgnify:CR=1 FL=1